MRLFWIRVGPKSTMTGTLIKKGTLGHRHRQGEHPVKMKAMMLSQAKEPQRWPANYQKVGESPGPDSLPHGLRRNQLSQGIPFGLLACQTVTRCYFCCWTQPVWFAVLCYTALAN